MVTIRVVDGRVGGEGAFVEANVGQLAALFVVADLNVQDC